MQINRNAKCNNELKDRQRKRDGREVLPPIGSIPGHRLSVLCVSANVLVIYHRTTATFILFFPPIQQTGQYNHHLSLLWLAKLIMNLRLGRPCSFVSLSRLCCLLASSRVCLFFLTLQIIVFLFDQQSINEEQRN